MYGVLLQTLEERGITKYRLAKMSKISPQDLYTVLNGHKPLYPGWKKRIAKALDVPERELFSDMDDDKLICEVEKCLQERVFYKGGLYYVDDYDTEGIYLLRYSFNDDGFGHCGIQDEICVPLTECYNMAICKL